MSTSIEAGKKCQHRVKSEFPATWVAPFTPADSLPAVCLVRTRRDHTSVALAFSADLHGPLQPHDSTCY